MTKFTKGDLVEDKYYNNEIEMNTKTEDLNDMDSASVKDKDKKTPSEASEETKKDKQSIIIRTNVSISRTVCNITTLV